MKNKKGNCLYLVIIQMNMNIFHLNNQMLNYEIIMMNLKLNQQVLQ